MKSLAVVKFGGSLIDLSGTNIPLIVKCISEMKALKDVGPIAIFSAPKGVTDKLIAIGEAKALGRSYDLDAIFTSYSRLASDYVKNDLIAEFHKELDKHRRYVEDTLLKVDRRFDGSARAKILTSGGELPTAALMNYVLRSLFYKSRFR